MLIVEGPDGAGKTTLVRALADYLKWPVADRVVDKNTKAMVDLKRWTEENLRRGFHHTIYDRHRLLSEPVYGPIMRNAGGSRRPESYDARWTWEMWQEFRRIDPLVIYCLPPFEVVKANVEADEDNQAIREKIDPIYRGYVSQYGMMAHEEAAAVWHYDYTQHEIKDIFDWVDDELEGELDD